MSERNDAFMAVINERGYQLYTAKVTCGPLQPVPGMTVNQVILEVAFQGCELTCLSIVNPPPLFRAAMLLSGLTNNVDPVLGLRQLLKMNVAGCAADSIYCERSLIKTELLKLADKRTSQEAKWNAMQEGDPWETEAV